MSDFLGIDVQGLSEIQGKLDKLPHEAQNTAVDEVSTYLINALHQYPPQRSVTMKQAYGGFVSEKQRRYFFAALADGTIQVPYRRTQALAQGWKQIGSGYKSIIANETPYGGYVMGDSGQSRMHNLIGWDKLSMFLAERREKIQSTLEAAVRKAIKKLGLS